MFWGRALTLVFVALAAGCPASDTFQCVSDAQCGDGVCEANEYCSFPDAMCDSGRRYGNQAATGIAGQCVPVDAGSSTGVGSSTAAPGSSTAPDTTSSGSTTRDARTSSSTGSGGEGSTTWMSASSTSWFGTSSTSTGGETSATGMPDSCQEALSCDECIDCVGQDGNSCGSAQVSCASIRGCSAISQCLRDCAVGGLCFDNCCEGSAAEAATAALELLECKQSVCGSGPCGRFGKVQCDL